MTGSLRMYRLRLDRRELAVLARRHHIPPNVDDPGYLVHAAFAGLFTDLAPKPFAIDPDGAPNDGAMTVLGYGDTPLADLLHRMQATADVQIANCLREDECCEKVMPNSWGAGDRFAFRARVCPVKRRSGRGPNAPEPALAGEYDAFLVWPQDQSDAEAGTMERRRDCYAQWLQDRVDTIGGASIESVTIQSFRLTHFVRRQANGKRTVPARGHSNSPGASGRPDVVLAGECTVNDSAAFTQLLTRGIGRHRAFGFGMILLKPV